MAFGSFQNSMYSGGFKAYVPKVGDGATELCWSDRHAYTIVEVRSERRVVVQADIAKRTDKNGMSECQTYLFEPNPKAPLVVLTLRKDGRWRRVGDKSGAFLLGKRMEYHDYSF